MSRVATIVPEESDLLCEGCGYTLNGLPTSGNCPECGKPIEQSTGQHRHRSPFERNPSFRTYCRTMGLILGDHRQFFNHLSILPRTKGAAKFARINLVIASALFWAAAVGHSPWVLWPLGRMGATGIFIARVTMLTLFIFGWPLTYLLLTGLTRLATWLSTVEARYWGMRLPYHVVLRGLHFHSADYIPVGLLSVAVIWGYRWLTGMEVLDYRFEDIYVYTLCGVVIVSAVYLFRTYWIAMKAMMWANR